MDPTPFLIMGALMGCGATLLVQAYGRRKVKKALAAIRKDELATVRTEREDRAGSEGGRARSETAEIARRLAVLEQIVTDRPAMLADEIEGLRREAM